MVEEASNEGEAFVVAENVSKRFGAHWALARASFKVKRGELALLVGDNGSGKTTLIRCLATGFVPDFGRASIFGHDLVTGRDEVRRRVASLSVPAGAYGSLSARENLTLADEVLGLSGKSAIDAALDRVGLSTRQDIPLDAFSAGMKQRFALARLSLLQRDLILLDEPETHLDAAGLGLLQAMLAEWKAAGAALVCATHAPERYQAQGDLVVRLVGGRPEPGGGAA